MHVVTVKVLPGACNVKVRRSSTDCAARSVTYSATNPYSLRATIQAVAKNASGGTEEFVFPAHSTKDIRTVHFRRAPRGFANLHVQPRRPGTEAVHRPGQLPLPSSVDVAERRSGYREHGQPGHQAAGRGRRGPRTRPGSEHRGHLPAARSRCQLGDASLKCVTKPDATPCTDPPASQQHILNSAAACALSAACARILTHSSLRCDGDLRV
jgi:hypothetical protein